MVEDELVKYKTLPIWNEDSLPEVFQEKHNTKAGTWAKLNVIEGELKYSELNHKGEVVASTILNSQHSNPMVQPQVWHIVKPLGSVRCFLEFYCKKEDYLQKKYKLSKVHPEIIEVLKYIQSGKVLDLGCGRGRNSLFLHSKGFEVEARDVSESAISKLNEIIESEKQYEGVHVRHYDINLAEIKDKFDMIISTVVLQFLNKSAIHNVMQDIQESTSDGGINVIVAPISSEMNPCPIDFPFTFKDGELRNYYSKWSILKYNENMGSFHKLDPKGQPYQAKFATLIAKK